jgi:hypothetical protein
MNVTVASDEACVCSRRHASTVEGARATAVQQNDVGSFHAARRSVVMYP